MSLRWLALILLGCLLLTGTALAQATPAELPKVVLIGDSIVKRPWSGK